jgi:hypothetical protein
VLMTGFIFSSLQEQFAVNYYGAHSAGCLQHIATQLCLPAMSVHEDAGGHRLAPCHFAGHWYLTQLMIDPLLEKGAEVVHRPSRVVWVSHRTTKWLQGPWHLDHHVADVQHLGGWPTGSWHMWENHQVCDGVCLTCPLCSRQVLWCMQVASATETTAPDVDWDDLECAQPACCQCLLVSMPGNIVDRE